MESDQTERPVAREVESPRKGWVILRRVRGSDGVRLWEWQIAEATEPVAQNKTPSHLGLRLALLAGLAIFADFWWQRHGNASLWEKVQGAPLMAIIPLAVTGMTLIAPDAESGWKALLRRVWLFFVSAPVLAILGVGVMFVSVMRSSVTVSAGPLEERTTVALQSQTSLRKGRAPIIEELASESVARFLPWTSLFGKTYIVKAHGYLPHSFTLYPLVGARLNLNRDFVFSPTVLVRVPFVRHNQLNKGRIELLSGTNQLASSPTALDTAAVFFGRKLPLTERVLADWEHELRRDHAAGDQFSRAFLAWRHPAAVALANDLIPTTRLRAQFVAANGQVFAQHEFVLGSEPLEDVPLIAIDPP